MQISGSTMLNLSLLTSDMWAVLIRIFAYNEKVRKDTAAEMKKKKYGYNLLAWILLDPYDSKFYFKLYFCTLQVDWMYFVAFAAVAIGICVYSGYADFLNTFNHLFLLPP